MCKWLLLTIGMITWAGCGDDTELSPDAPSPDAPADGEPAVTTAMVGPEGGEVDAGNGVTISIPAESVDAATTVTITISDTAAPAEFVNASPVIEFGPAGLVFARPVRVTLPIAGAPANPAIYWSKRVGSGFERIGGTVEGTTVVAEITHFSSAFVAATTTATRTVQVTALDSQFDAAGSLTLVPRDLSSTTLHVLTPTSTGYSVISAQGRTDGTASIPEVPDGFYLVQVDDAPTYSGATGSAIDIGVVTSPAGHVVANQTTPLAVDATNMTAWQDGDSFELYSVPANATYYLTPDPSDPDMSNVPTAGDTSLTGFGFDSRYTFPFPSFLIKQGDPTTMLHIASQQSVAGVPYVSAKELFTTTTLDQMDGQASTITGTFTTAGATAATFSLDVPVTSWEALATTVAPSGATVTPSHGFSIEARAGTMDNNTLSFLSLDVPAGADLTTGAMSYLVPGDATWQLFTFAFMTFRACQTAPGATAQACVGLTLRRFDAVDDVNNTPLLPELGPVAGVELNGVALTSNLTGVGLTPVVSWTAPTTGTPTYYRVVVRRFPAGGNSQVVAQLRTTETSLRLPPGILAAGQVYAVVIQANREPNTPTNQLLRKTVPSRDASMLSAFFSP